MTTKVTPFMLTRDAIERNPMLMTQREEARLGKPGDYSRCETIESDETEAEFAAEVAWARFQNIDKNRMSPGGVRSMMCGDLVLVEREDKPKAWLVAMSFGFSDVTDKIGNENMTAAF